MKSKNDLKIGDRVKVISVPDLSGEDKVKITIGMTGTVKDLTESCAGVEFDDYINGNGGVCGFWEGKYGHCCCVLRKDLEKIEDTDERMDTERMSNDKVMINHPPHYTVGKVECIDAIESATNRLQGLEAVCTANVIKYVWRWKFKNGVEDLEKASWYLNKLIKEVKNNSQE